MADIVQSLFGLTPEAYQQQQAAAADRMALEYAQLSPIQQAQFAIGRGAYQLAGALGGALGAQDPMLQLISKRQAIARQVDYTNPESMASGVQALADAGDTVGAMQLSQVLRQAQSEMAQRTQRLAAAQASLAAAGRERTEASPNDVRIAREFAAQKGEPGSPEYNAEFTAQLTRLTTKPEGAGPREVQLARELALRAGPVGSPEYTAAYNAELGRLTTPERAAESTPEIRNATALASQKGQPGSPEFQAEFAAQLARLTTKTEADRPTDAMRNADALALLKGPKGSPEYNAEYSAQLARLTSKAEQRGPSVGAEREAESLAQYGKTFAELTQEQQRIVNQRVSAEQSSRATANAPKIILPGQPVGPQDWMKFENFISGDPTLKRTNELLSVMPSAIDTISRITTNDVAARALPATLARLVGETGPLSNRDVARFARTGGLDDRLAQAATEFITGRGTQQQKDQAVRYLSAVYRGALLEKRKLYVDQAERLGYNQSPEYRVTLAQLDRELAKFREVRPQQPAAPGTQPAQAPRAGTSTQNRMSDEELLRLYGQPQGR